MHVGWAALFSPPKEGPAPSFEELRDHIGGRLGRAPRYRQKLAPVPFAVHNPVWVDDDHFDLRRHVCRAASPEIGEVIDQAMSTPLDQQIPLWQLDIAENLSDGRIGVVGKAHHCMVDGIAAVELAGLLLDPTVRPPSSQLNRWKATPGPSAVELLTRGVGDRLLDPLAVFGGFDAHVARARPLGWCPGSQLDAERSDLVLAASRPRQAAVR
jgi:hypothetical protein